MIDLKKFFWIAIYDLVPPAVIPDKSTNSWTTIAFIEGLARNIRRTLFFRIRNARFHWIISPLIADIFSRKSRLEI